jgi:hypothetical protein
MVQVYRNLNTGKWSVRKGGHVIAQLDDLWLRGCRYVIQPGGRARALATGRRNVHAYVVGEIIPTGIWSYGSEVTYDFWVGYFFARETGDPVAASNYAHCKRGKLVAFGLNER